MTTNLSRAAAAARPAPRVRIVNSDIRGFTRLTEQIDPDDVVEMLNEHAGGLVPIIFGHQGTIDKFMGEAILAVFGSPEPDQKQYEHVVLAAVEMQADLAKINEARTLPGLACAEAGIGIHCGEVVRGFVSTLDRMEFTVAGEVVNRTARYCIVAGKGEVHERVRRIVEIEQATIPTKHKGTFVAYRITGVKPFLEQGKKKCRCKTGR